MSSGAINTAFIGPGADPLLTRPGFDKAWAVSGELVRQAAGRAVGILLS